MRVQAAFCGQCTSDAAGSKPSERRDRCVIWSSAKMPSARQRGARARFATALYFWPCSSVLPAASRAAHAAIPGLFAPGLNTRAGTSPRALQEFARLPSLLLCLASVSQAKGDSI